MLFCEQIVATSLQSTYRVAINTHNDVGRVCGMSEERQWGFYFEEVALGGMMSHSLTCLGPNILLRASEHNAKSSEREPTRAT